jgi:ABC-2 type transport system ATP-binding protein
MIEASGLTKRYGGPVAADGLSFEVRPGTVTGFPARTAPASPPRRA